MTKHIVVVGGGMVAHRFVDAALSRATSPVSLTVFAEEDRLPYDRVALSSYFSGRAPEDLTLAPDIWDDERVTMHLSSPVVSIDRARRVVATAQGHEVIYDELVMATGSYAWVPPVTGADSRGVFVYRTVNDVTQLHDWVQVMRSECDRPVRGVVVGGGLLGLEAAGALMGLEVETTVVEFAPRLMALQVDDGGGHMLKRLVNDMGVDVRVGAGSNTIITDDAGRVSSVVLTTGDVIPVDVVVFATGVRPRDEVATAAGLHRAERGGIVVDSGCVSSDPNVYAIGEVAAINGQSIGLVAPGYAMAEIAANRILGGKATFTEADLSTKLKLLGVDVASFGDAFAHTPGALELVFSDPVAGTYKKLVVSDDTRTLLGGMLVGDASAYASLRPLVGSELTRDPALYLFPENADGIQRQNSDLPDQATVCSCNNVSAGDIRCAVTDSGCLDIPGVKASTKAGTSCGSCLPLVKKLVSTELEKSGVAATSAMCEHFSMPRADLFNAVMVTGLRSFRDIIGRFGNGRGCDICKPAVASILASLYSEHVLADDRAALQDTNDRYLANIQRDGTYSVVPRVPGGVITPEQLMVIGQVAQDFGLYTKITGGQRIDLFGAKLQELPIIWQRLINAGMESGQAYGKSLRTVKSCVGSQWCRFGVQDSVGMAIHLELRYRGLRAPHKIKMAVSGCARECAEARSKDVGLIATDVGWNIYVGGNGGFTPRHGELLVDDVDDETAIRLVDRYLMYYIRTADRLQRTAPWQAEHKGGLERIREIVVDDALGICAELESQMSAHVENYEDEWAAVLADPDRRRQFIPIVNAPISEEVSS